MHNSSCVRLAIKPATSKCGAGLHAVLPLVALRAHVISMAASGLLQQYPTLRAAVSLSRLLAAVADSELLSRMLSGTDEATAQLGAALRAQGLAAMGVWVVSLAAPT